MTKLGIDTWLPIGWSNPYNFLTAMLPTLQTRSFYCRGLTRICTPAQDGQVNPKMLYCFMVHQIFSLGERFKPLFFYVNFKIPITFNSITEKFYQINH